MTTNYILHFNGRELKVQGIFYSIRFELDSENINEFFNVFCDKYEFNHVTAFYIDGEKTDFQDTFQSYLEPLFWQIYDKQGSYTFWVKQDRNGKKVYNVTSDGKRPNTDGGYFQVEYLYRVKGLNKIGTI